jgi:diaminohydroxyphosphoribosylaminopyrimidine deaminase/5-amino-6-(5-phosphoribosylamino)uracil reductase
MPVLSDDRKFMTRCFELAVRGKGSVSPNPMVGCVLVKNGRVIAEGYHRRFGGAHAEVDALKRAGRNAKGAVLYVNLEPCAHHGKTPPCVGAIIRAGVKRVVASCVDPNRLVASKGFKVLRQAGIGVRVGIMAREAEELNEKYLFFMKKRMPFVGLKIAQTLDGRSADSTGSSKWITGVAARSEGHRIRSEYDAILVGAGTVRKDNPKLTVRLAKGRNPVRVILDPHLSTDTDSLVYRTGFAETLLLTSAAAMTKRGGVVRKLTRKGVRILGLDDVNSFDLRMVLRILSALGISSVLVEGGPSTASQFLESNLVQRVHWFIAPKLLGGGISSFSHSEPLRLARSIIIRDCEVSSVGDDILVEGRPWSR